MAASPRWERRSVLLALSAGLFRPQLAAPQSGDVLVFAAASLTEALREIGDAFEKRTTAAVVFSFAGSNDLARQIRAGAPADVFVSADLAQMDELQQAGFVDAADRVELLSNRLVVVVPAASAPLPRSARELRSVARLALADPQVVPAGRYARQWLERVGEWAALRERVVPALDVRAALAAVESGNAEAGIVYRTDAVVSRRAKLAFEVAAAEAPRIVYPAAVLAASRSPAARAFLAELRSGQARAVFERRGFEVLSRR